MKQKIQDLPRRFATKLFHGWGKCKATIDFEKRQTRMFMLRAGEGRKKEKESLHKNEKVGLIHFKMKQCDVDVSPPATI